MIELQNKTQFDSLILQSSDVVLADFWAPWCGPCRMLLPVLEEISETVKVVKINVDDFADISNEYEIQSVPTLILFKDGKVVATRSGFASKAVLLSWIEDKTK